MPLTQRENEKYRQYVSDVAKDMGIFDFQPDQIVWHYTNGTGFLGILQSATLYATQVASLNDVRETKYGTDLYKDAVKALLAGKAGDPVAVNFLNAVLEFIKEEPSISSQPATPATELEGNQLGELGRDVSHRVF
jgi:hypothetical protein